MNKRETISDVVIDECVIKFMEAIDVCRGPISDCMVDEEANYQYVLLRVYSRIILACCEICTLLEKGYPQGALIICRNLFEGVCLLNLLLEGFQKKDTELVKKFFDANRIELLINAWRRLMYVKGHDSGDVNCNQALKYYDDKLKEYADMYPNNVHRNGEKWSTNSDYWWNGCRKPHTEWIKASRSSMDSFYRNLSNMVHFNFFCCMADFAENDSEIIIGDTEKGKEFPFGIMVTMFYDVILWLNQSMKQYVPDSVRIYMEKFYASIKEVILT